MANSLPYSLDLIVTPHCSGFSASHTSIGGIPSDWSPTPKVNIQSVESAINVVAASGAINISLSIPARTDVEIDIYDASGRLVKNIKGSSSGNGKFIYNWDGLANDGTECSPGVYLIRVKYGDTILTRKAILVR